MQNAEYLDNNYASLGRRSLALFLDTLILLIPCGIGGHIIPIIGGIAIWFFYAPILESSNLRATLGKHLVGIQVVDLDGRKISLRAALIRNALKCASSVLVGIGFIFALFNRRQQTLHDLLAETVVVYGRSNLPIGKEWMDTVKDVFESAKTTPHQESDISKLERLQALRDKGALTEEEFQEQKKKVFGK